MGISTFRPAFLMPDLIDYNFVGRVENFVADSEHVLTMIDAPPEVVKTASMVINPTYKVHPALVFDQELADIVYAMYKVDFENYGYDRESWMFA